MPKFRVFKTRRPAGSCPHSLVTWYAVPSRKYGTDRPDYVAVTAPCKWSSTHVGDHVADGGRRWR